MCITSTKTFLTQYLLPPHVMLMAFVRLGLRCLGCRVAGKSGRGVFLNLPFSLRVHLSFSRPDIDDTRPNAGLSYMNFMVKHVLIQTFITP